MIPNPLRRLVAARFDPLAGDIIAILACLAIWAGTFTAIGRL